MKKLTIAVMMGLALCFVMTGCTSSNQEVVEQTEAVWTPDSLKKGLTTAIEYNKQYNTHIESKEEAADTIRQYGIMQREQYSNPQVEAIELQMEEDYDLLAVNLGEVDKVTAQDVEEAFSYMYETYPQLKGKLTNVTLGNFEGAGFHNIALTRYHEFMMNGDIGELPLVVKHEIVLNAAQFRKRNSFLESCQEQVESGHWPEGSNMTSMVVHELGHQLLNAIIMEEVGFADIYYVTKDNIAAYNEYCKNGLSMNQTIEKEIIHEAYEMWKEEYGNIGSEEDFRGSISGYALGLQSDGGISYSETFAEAVADVYLNGDNAADASKVILKVARKK